MLITIGTFAIFGGFAMPKLYQISFLCELSQVFFAIREFKGKATWTGPWAMVNNILFFVSWTLVRTILFPMTLIAHYRATYLYDFAAQSVIHKVCFWMVCLSFSLIIILNMYWYSFIINGLLRVLSGKASKNPLEDEDEMHKLPDDDFH